MFSVFKGFKALLASPAAALSTSSAVAKLSAAAAAQKGGLPTVQNTTPANTTISAAAAAWKAPCPMEPKETPKKTANSKPKAQKQARPRTATLPTWFFKLTPVSLEKPARRRTTTRSTGIFKLTPVSPALGQFLGAQQAYRTQAVKQIWAYIKSNNLLNPNNKREIFCDEKLKTIFNGKEKVGFEEIVKLLSHHFLKTA